MCVCVCVCLYIYIYIYIYYMNSKTKAGVHARQEKRDHFWVDKNFGNFSFPQKIIENKTCHYFFTFFDAGVFSFEKQKKVICYHWEKWSTCLQVDFSFSRLK